MICLLITNDIPYLWGKTKTTHCFFFFFSQREGRESLEKKKKITPSQIEVYRLY